MVGFHSYVMRSIRSCSRIQRMTLHQLSALIIHWSRILQIFPSTRVYRIYCRRMVLVPLQWPSMLTIQRLILFISMRVFIALNDMRRDFASGNALRICSQWTCHDSIIDCPEFSRLLRSNGSESCNIPDCRYSFNRCHSWSSSCQWRLEHDNLYRYWQSNSRGDLNVGILR